MSLGSNLQKQTKRKRVMIIDDEIDNLQFVRIYCNLAGLRRTA